MPSRTNKLRGSRTHGRGKKAGRGAGLIGGHGGAGYLKHERMRMLKYHPERRCGVKGFKRPQGIVSANRVINLITLNESIPSLVEEGKISKEGDKYQVDLTQLGFDKLLGTGSVDFAIDVTVNAISNSAREKIEAAGGSIVE